MNLGCQPNYICKNYHLCLGGNRHNVSFTKRQPVSTPINNYVYRFDSGISKSAFWLQGETSGLCQ